MKKNIISMILVVCMVISSFISPDMAAAANVQNDAIKSAADYAEDDVVHGDGITAPLSKLLTMTDYQKWSSSGTDDWDFLRGQLADILAGASSAGASPDYMLFGGDTSCLNSADTSGTGQDQMLSTLRNTWPNLTGEKCVIIQGNHDPANTKGMASTGAYYFKDFIIYVVNEDDFPTKQEDESVLPGIEATANDLKEWLDDRVENKETRPIFIASHTGLHYDIDRKDGNNQYAYVMFDAINDAAKQLDIVFFFGHNHTNGDEQVGGSLTLYQKGDKLNICTEKSIADKSGTPSTINFTYMNYGYIGYIGDISNNPSEFEPTDALTVSQLSIYNDRIEVVRYSKDGVLEDYNRTISRDHASESQTAAKKYTVYYKARGGQLPVESEEVYEGIYLINRKIPTRSGYIFKYYEDDEGNRYQPGDEINITSDVTLNAGWQKLSQGQSFTLTDTINPGKKYILVWNSDLKGNAGTRYALTAGDSGVTVTTLDSSCFTNDGSVINIPGNSADTYLWDIIWNQGENEARGYVLQNVGTKKYLCNSGTEISLGTDPVNAFKEYAWVYNDPDNKGYNRLFMYNDKTRFIRYSVGSGVIKLGTTATSTDVNNSNVYLYELYEPDNYVWELTDKLESNEQYLIASAGEAGKANVLTVSKRSFGKMEVTIKNGTDNVKYIEHTAAYNDVAVWHPYEVAGNMFWLDSWNAPTDSEVLWLDSSALKITSNHADSRYYFRFTYQDGELSAYQGLSGTENKRSMVYSNGFTVGTGSNVYLFKRVYKERPDSAKKYEVYYEARGGQLPVTSEEVYEGIYVINRNAPTRSGYIFQYYEDEEGNTYQPGDAIHITSDVTLKARWEKLPQVQGEGQTYVLTDTINPGKKYILVWNSDISGNAGAKHALTAGDSGVTVTTLDSSYFSNDDSVISISGNSADSYLWDIIWNQGSSEARGYVLQNVGTKKYLCNSNTAISLGTDPVNAFKQYAWVYRDYKGYNQLAMYNNNDRYIRYSAGGKNVKLGTTETDSDVNNSNVYLYELCEPDNYVWELTDRLESNEQYMIASTDKEGTANVLTVSGRTFGQDEVTIKNGTDDVKYIERTAAYNDVAVWHPYEVADNAFWLDSWNKPNDAQVLWLNDSALAITSNHADSRYYFRFNYENGELSAYQGLSGTENRRSLVYSNGFTVGTGSNVYLFKRVYKEKSDPEEDDSAAKAELNDMIAEAEKAYSEFGGEALHEAIESAKAVLGKEDASEDEIYDALSAIRKEIKQAEEERLPRVTGVSVTPKTASVEQGEAQTFAATVTGENNPSTEVIWSVSGGSSADTKITMDGKLIVGSNETATTLTVTATSEEDGTKSDTATVTVTKKETPQPTVTAVTVTPKTASVKQGEEQTFAAAVTGENNPSTKVIWSVSGAVSADTKITQGGKLTVGSNETAAMLTVTATSEADDTKSDTATVTVTKSDTPTPQPTVTAVTVTPKTASVKQGEEQTFTAAVTGENNPSTKVTWSVSGGSSADTKITQSGKLTVGSNETAPTLTVTATSEADDTKSDTATVTVTKNDTPTPQPTVTAVTVAPKTASVEQGKEQDFTATVTGENDPSTEVSWSVSGGKSANTKITQEGKLTVGSNETAATLTVTAISKADDTKSDTATVTVVKSSGSDPVNIVKPSLNVTKITLGAKESFTLKVKKAPAGKIKYSSNKPKIASVNKKGKITAKKKGSAVITVTMSNGKKLTCKVTVKNAPKKISLSKKSITLKKGKKYQIKVKLPKKTASYKITYKSNKKSVASVTASGKVTARKKGKATITVTTFNKKKATLKITVK